MLGMSEPVAIRTFGCNMKGKPWSHFLMLRVIFSFITLQ